MEEEAGGGGGREGRVEMLGVKSTFRYVDTCHVAFAAEQNA